LVKHSKGYHLKLLLHRHSSLLTWTGALLVFLTFVVKEGLRDNLKELTDSLDREQNVFLTRIQTSEMLLGVSRLERRGELLESEITHKPPVRTDFNQVFDERINLLGDELRAADAYADGLSRLSRMMSLGPVDKDDLDTVKKVLPDFRESYNQLLALVVQAESHHTFESPEASRAKIESMRLDLELKAGVTLNTLKNSSDRLLSRMEEQKEKDERRYTWAVWGSYVLYPLGWGLGLIAKLYGLEGPERE